MNMLRTKAADAGVTLTAAQCAKRTGLTVKALRVYEREGLLSPKRTIKDWRSYDASDLARLGEVTALRALGFRLADIRKLLKGKSGDISRMLELQQEDLLARRDQIEGALSLVGELRSRAAMGETLNLNDLTTAIKESHMTATTAEAASWKCYEQMRPRIAIAPDVENMGDCAGHYKLAETSIFNIFAQNGRLMSQLTGQQALQIFPEAKDRYFYTAVPAQISFERGNNGEVVALVLHQNGADHRAERISSSAADQATAALAARIKSNTPVANSKETMEAILRSQMAGIPPTALMNEGLAQLAREQNEVITKDLAELGALKSLTFLTVVPDGSDAFRATFENGELDCSIHLGADGKADGATLDPPRTEEFWTKLRQKLQA